MPSWTRNYRQTVCLPTRSAGEPRWKANHQATQAPAPAFASSEPVRKGGSARFMHIHQKLVNPLTPL
jgi:hypothetical protein